MSRHRPRRWTTDPSTHLPTLACRWYRAPRDRLVARRADQLLRVLDLHLPGGARAEHLPPLALLAGVPWGRRADAWEGGPTPLRSLTDHLVRLVRYPLPEVLYGLLFEGGALSDDRRRAVQVLARLGGGEGLRDLARARLVPDLPRASHHALFALQQAPTLTAAFRGAHALASGGTIALAEALGGTRLRDPQPDDPRWYDTIAWMAREDLPPASVREVVDWLAATGSAVPGRSAAQALASADRWHRDLAQRWARPAFSPLPLPRPPWAEGEVDAAGFRVVWLGSGAALGDEGAALAHCVVSYEALARAGICSLWSLRRGGERRVTIEVRHAERAVVQVRGHRNRLPTAEERAAVAAWAASQGLRTERV